MTVRIRIIPTDPGGPVSRLETDLHAAAVRELIVLAEGTAVWGLPVFCVGEFIRVVTHRRILNPPSTLPQAVSFLERLLASPSCRIVRPGPDFVSLLAAASLAAGARGNLVFDAQIVALCREHGIREPAGTVVGRAGLN